MNELEKEISFKDSLENFSLYEIFYANVDVSGFDFSSDYSWDPAFVSFLSWYHDSYINGRVAAYVRHVMDVVKLAFQISKDSSRDYDYYLYHPGTLDIAIRRKKQLKDKMLLISNNGSLELLNDVLYCTWGFLQDYLLLYSKYSKTSQIVSKHIAHSKPVTKTRKVSKFLPMFTLEEGADHLPYRPDFVSPTPKNGQQKLLNAFLSFLARNYVAGDVILLYGAAPGYSIIRLASYLKVSVICIDDFPMVRYPMVQYYSFSEFLTLDVTYDGIFFDNFEPGMEKSDSYYKQLQVLDMYQSRRVRYVSFKRFADLDGVQDRKIGSVCYPMIFASPHSLEFREELILADLSELNDEPAASPLVHYPIEKSLAVVYGLRKWNYFATTTKNFSPNVYGCQCYACGMSDYHLRGVAEKCKVEFINLAREVVFANAYKPVSHESMLKIQQGQPQFQTPKLVCKPRYKKAIKAMAGPDNYNSFLYGNVRKFRTFYVIETSKAVLDVETLLIEAAVDVEKSKGPNKRIRAYEREVKAVVVGARGTTKHTRVLYLPRVNVLVGLRGTVKFKSIVGEDKTFKVSQQSSQPPCLWCGSARSQTGMDNRRYLALFKPVGFSCSTCHYESVVTYESIEI